MPVENEYQKRIIDSVRKYDGYAKKWSSRFMLGVPDLIIALPWRGGLVMEVKREKIETADGAFDRSVHASPRQGQELRLLNKAGMPCYLGVILAFDSRDVWLQVCPHDIQRLTDRSDYPKVQWDPRAKFDIRKVL